MNTFLNDFKNFTKANNYNIFRAVEVKDGVRSEFTEIPTCNALNCYSISKAFVVTAVGMLYDDGLLKPSDKITDLLGDECPKNTLECYRTLTVDDALSHRIGLPLNYLDVDCAHPDTYGKDFLGNMLSTVPEKTPGTEPIYTDAAFYLLSRTVEKLAKMPIENMMWERLFTPLHFSEAAWSKCPMGHALGGTGLHINTVDMSKLGEVYLGGGMYENTRIISKEWVDTVISSRYEFHPICGGKGYGKPGMNGQMLLFVPEKNRVVAWHAYGKKGIGPLIEWAVNYQN